MDGFYYKTQALYYNLITAFEAYKNFERTSKDNAQYKCSWLNKLYCNGNKLAGNTAKYSPLQLNCITHHHLLSVQLQGMYVGCEPLYPLQAGVASCRDLLRAAEALHHSVL